MTGHEYTIEGAPELKVNWEAEYNKQRRSRLVDAIDDYLQDEKIDPTSIYEEMLDVLNELITFHSINLNKVQDLKNMMTNAQ